MDLEASEHYPESVASHGDAEAETLTYNDISARSLDRIGALSDGLFAIAMTLIVLEIQVPDLGSTPSDAALWRAIVSLAPRFLTYGLSFLTLGLFWSGQQTQLSYFRASDRNLAWIHLGFLAAVALMPFSTSVLADYITVRVALVVYWANLALLGVFIYGSWAYASRTGLVKSGTPPAVSRAVRRRIVVYQALYALAVSLCVVSTYLSIGLLVLLQLNSAVAPRLRWLSSF